MKGGINLAGRQITVIGNSRQMPSNRSTVREKDYCDLLYAWLQCHSEKLDSEKQRRIHKSLVKWTAIESDFTRTDKEGKIYKVMSRKTIAKYFGFLEEKELVELKDDYYYLTVLSPENANLIECKTLDKLMNVFQKNSLNIYNYLINEYCRRGQVPFIITIRQIKDFIGIATSTTSNNGIVDDTIDILQRLSLLDYQIKYIDNKSYIEIQWVRNALPETKFK